MQKVAAAVIKYEDKVLLMRRAPGQKLAGFWEFPGGKVENGERVSAALHRELDEELDIKAKIGKLITSVKDGAYEIYAYDVKYYDGLIRLSVHDDMEWVPLNMALSYKLLPADKKIVMYITKTKEEKAKPASITSVIDQIITRPVLDPKTNKYVVEIKNGFFGKTQSFPSEDKSLEFYMDTVRDIMQNIQKRPYIPER